MALFLRQFRPLSHTLNVREKGLILKLMVDIWLYNWKEYQKGPEVSLKNATVLTLFSNTVCQVITD